jgi:hypothetical protein
MHFLNVKKNIKKLSIKFLNRQIIFKKLINLIYKKDLFQTNNNNLI